MSHDNHNFPTGPPLESSIVKTPTHIRGLDDILKGGLPSGRTTVFNGAAGTGKTVLALEFLYRAAQSGDPSLFISFEERVQDIKANALGMGMDITALEEQGKFKVVSAELPHEAVQAGEFDTRGLMAMIEGHARQMGVKRIVLDSLDVLLAVFDDPVLERRELYFLHTRLRDLGVTSVLTVKVDPRGKTIYPFLDFTADCVMFLDQRISGQIRTRRLTVLKYRGSGFMDKEYPYVFTPGGVVILPVTSMSLTQPLFGKRVSSGHDMLDELLGGGYFQGSCILIGGPSGSGKTSLACTFALAACERKEKVLYVDFEVSREALVGGMQSIGLDLQSALDLGENIRLLTIMPESAGTEGHLLRIIDEINTLGPDHIVVDAISACQRMGSEQAAFDFLVRLMTHCKSLGITCLYTNQVTGNNDLTQISGIGISSLVDTLLALEYFFAGDRLRRRLLAIKSRGSVHSMDYHQMTVSDSGLQLAKSTEKQNNGSGPGR